MSVDVAPCVLIDGWVPDFVDDLLRYAQLPPDRLTIEISGPDCDDSRSLRDAVHTLSSLGVRLSLDDFGTDRATLTQLHMLPFNEMKIDQTFIRHVGARPADRNIVQFGVRLAHDLGLDVVANGVHNEPTRDELRRLGLHLLQGDHIHLPSSPDDIPVLFARSVALDLRSDNVINLQDDAYVDQ